MPSASRRFIYEQIAIVERGSSEPRRRSAPGTEIVKCRIADCCGCPTTISKYVECRISEFSRSSGSSAKIVNCRVSDLGGCSCSSVSAIVKCRVAELGRDAFGVHGLSAGKSQCRQSPNKRTKYYLQLFHFDEPSPSINSRQRYVERARRETKLWSPALQCTVSPALEMTTFQRATIREGRYRGQIQIHTRISRRKHPGPVFFIGTIETPDKFKADKPFSSDYLIGGPQLQYGAPAK